MNNFVCTIWRSNSMYSIYPSVRKSMFSISTRKAMYTCIWSQTIVLVWYVYLFITTIVFNAKIIYFFLWGEGEHSIISFDLPVFCIFKMSRLCSYFCACFFLQMRCARCETIILDSVTICFILLLLFNDSGMLYVQSSHQNEIQMFKNNFWLP